MRLMLGGMMSGSHSGTLANFRLKFPASGYIFSVLVSACDHSAREIVSSPSIALLKNIWKNDLVSVEEVNFGLVISKIILLYSILELALPSLTVGMIRRISRCSGL
jgi:hypothetical protein